MLRGATGRWRMSNGPVNGEPPVVRKQFSVPIDVEVRLAQPGDLPGLEAWSGFDTPPHRRALRYYLTMQSTGLGCAARRGRR